MARPLPPRALRRAAPAGRHRPRAGHGAEPDRLRRAGLGARRLDPGPDHQPAGGAPGRVRADLPVRRPRPRRWCATSPTGSRSCISARSWRSPTGKSLYEDPQHPYTKALLSAVPIPDPVVEAGREHWCWAGRCRARSIRPSGLRVPPPVPHRGGRMPDRRFPSCGRSSPGTGRPASGLMLPRALTGRGRPTAKVSATFHGTWTRLPQIGIRHTGPVCQSQRGGGSCAIEPMDCAWHRRPGPGRAGRGLAGSAAPGQAPHTAGSWIFVVPSEPPSYDAHAEETFGVTHPIAPHYNRCCGSIPSTRPAPSRWAIWPSRGRSPRTAGLHLQAPPGREVPRRQRDDLEGRQGHPTTRSSSRRRG